MDFKRFLQSAVLIAMSGLLASCGSSKDSTNSANAPTAAVAQLNGAFTFSANGTDPADGDYFVAGSFTADGKGGLNGLEDLNLGSGVDSNVPFTGTYQIDSSGAVFATISDGTGVPTFLTFSVPSGSSGAKLNYDGTGSGTLQAQTASAFSNAGTFTFTLNGEGEGTVTASGSFATDVTGSFTAGTESFQDGQFNRDTTALGGVLTPAFGGGRGTAVIGPDIFAYYVVSQNKMILAGLGDSTLIYGTATKQ